MYLLSHKQRRISMIYEQALKQKEHLEAELATIDQKLKNCPPGNLFFSHDKGRCKWYQSNGHNQHYISKKNRSFAEQLAFKKYLTYLRDDLLHEKESLERYINNHMKIEKAPQLLAPQSEYREFLLPYLMPTSEDLIKWQNEDFEHNTKHPEQLNQPTLSGKLVRSKSEALIDTILFNYQLPYRYECALPIDNKIFYPDFTIRHPNTGKIYYWEHFGMMDVPSYFTHAYSKLQKYAENDIIPNVNLITTFETKEAPLNPELVETLVKHYFT